MLLMYAYVCCSVHTSICPIEHVSYGVHTTLLVIAFCLQSPDLVCETVCQQTYDLRYTSVYIGCN